MDAVRAVVEDHHVAPGEEVVVEELAQREVDALAGVVLGRHEVPHVAVQDKLVDGLGEVAPRELLRPRGVVGERVGGGRRVGHRARQGAGG